MKHTKNSRLIIFILLLSIFMPIISYAIYGPTSTKKDFFTTNTLEVCQGETATMNLNLSSIPYEEFKFTLTSNCDLKELSVEPTTFEAAQEGKEIQMIVKSSELKMEQISFHYPITEEIPVESKINLIATIEEIKSEITQNTNSEQTQSDATGTKTTSKDEQEVGKQEQEGNQQTKEENSETIANQLEKQQISITITVVEKKQTSDQNQENSKEENKKPSLEEKQTETNIPKQENNKNSIPNETNHTKVTQTQLAQTQTKTIANGLSKQETNIYEGESNNYLSSLIIEEYPINPQFTKTNSTYFITVPSKVNELKIQAQAEDENATVTIYGNENLQEGQNKILLTVTAENGSVKMYRIYVTKANS